MCAPLFFFNDPPTTEIYPLSRHDALPISVDNTDPATLRAYALRGNGGLRVVLDNLSTDGNRTVTVKLGAAYRSEEHTSELQSRQIFVCRLLLEKKNT